MIKIDGVEIEKAWEKTKGKGVKVCVLDTGVDSDHTEIRPNLVAAKDFTGSIYGVEDRKGHGTHVCGILLGVAPQVELYVGKVIEDGGKWEHIAQGIRWAILCEVDVISMSLGSDEVPPKWFHDVIKMAHDKGIILVGACSNSSKVSYPAMYDEVIAVNRTESIVSSWLDGCYVAMRGTSQATPIVAGFFALIISLYKDDILLNFVLTLFKKMCNIELRNTLHI